MALQKVPGGCSHWGRAAVHPGGHHLPCEQSCLESQRLPYWESPLDAQKRMLWLLACSSKSPWAGPDPLTHVLPS